MKGSTKRRVWPALLIRSGEPLPPGPPSALEESVSAVLDDFSPLAIEDLAQQPTSPGGLWDPTRPPLPERPSELFKWRVFFATFAARSEAVRALRGTHPELAVSTEEILDEDWAARSQRELTAITAGIFVVAPPWAIPAQIDPRTLLVVIEPSRGFGTGHHASTRLCLRALSETDVQGSEVLDLGTGSGVLAIAAALKGADHVVGVDVDPDAIDAARASHALNPRASGVEWLTGDFRDRRWDALTNGCWNLVLANLTGGMLRLSADRIRELLAPGGLLIAGGFDENERQSVQDAFQLNECATFFEDEWAAVVMMNSR